MPGYLNRLSERINALFRSTDSDDTEDNSEDTQDTSSDTTVGDIIIGTDDRTYEPQQFDPDEIHNPFVTDGRHIIGDTSDSTSTDTEYRWSMAEPPGVYTGSTDLSTDEFEELQANAEAIIEEMVASGPEQQTLTADD